MNRSNSTIRIRCAAGNSITQCAPVILENSKELLTGFANRLRLFSIETGLHINDYIISDRNESKITSIVSHPFDASLVLIAFRNGDVYYWSSKDHMVTQKTRLKCGGKKLTKIGCVVMSEKCLEFDLIALFSEETTRTAFFKIHSSVDGKSKYDVPLNAALIPSSWSVSSKGNKKFVAGVNEDNLEVYDFTAKRVFRKIKIGGNKYYTCVSCHPTEDCVAAGDTIGRVIIYRDIFSSRDRCPHNIYHWHTLPVNCITFTESGSSFYSGGSENVLVKWNTEKSELKSFIPRLSGTISNIINSDSNQTLAVLTADNCILVADAALIVKCLIQELTKCTTNDEMYPIGLKVDNRSKCLVTNGRPGYAQFFSTQRETVLYSIDIAQQNYLSQERTKKIYNSEVYALDISDDGNWLVASETRKDPDFDCDTYLKFFIWNKQKHAFNLKTFVTSSHFVSEIAFQPSDPFVSGYSCAVACSDSKFRIWTQNRTTGLAKGQNSRWVCDRVGYYKNYELRALTWSEDGSIIGAAFGPCFTIWDTDDMRMKVSLSKGFSPLKSIHFGAGECSYVAVSANRSCFFVWDLQTLQISWMLELYEPLIVKNPFSRHMAVFSGRKLFIFDYASSEPVYSNVAICEEGEGIIAATFYPNSEIKTGDAWLRKASLYFLTTDHCLMTIENSSRSAEKSTANIAQSHFVAPFKRLIAEKQSSDVTEMKGKLHIDTSDRALVSKFVSEEPHTMAPVSMYCESLLEAFLSQCL